MIWETKPWSSIESAERQLTEAIHRASLGESVRIQAARATCDTESPFDVLVAPLPTSEATIRAVAVLTINLTARVPAAMAETDRQNLYRAIVEDQSEMIVRWSSDWIVTFVNGAASRYLNRPPQEIIGKSFLRRVPEEQLPALYAHIAALTPESPIATLEHSARVGDQVRWLQWTTRAVFDGDAHPLEYQSVGRDKTEGRDIERSLRLTQFSIDCASESVFWVSPSAEILYVNETARRTLGYSRDELIGKFVVDIDPNFTADTWPARWEELKQRKSFSFESQHRTKYGNIFDTEVTANYISFEGQELSCAIVRNITDRKHAEQKLQMMQFSIDHAAEAIYWVAPDGKILYANDAACDHLGFSAAELLELSVPDFDLDYHARAWPAHWEEVKRRSSLIFESLHKSKDGRLIPVEITANHVRAGGQEFNLTFSRDITDRKRAESDLRRSEERFAKLFHAAPYAILLAEYPTGHIVEVNASFLRLFEFVRAEVWGKLDSELNLWEHPGDRIQAMQALESNGSTRDREVALRTKLGRARTVLLTQEIIELHGRQHALSTFTDITERKLISEQADSLRDALAHVGRVDTLGEMTSCLAHELNQPLTSLMLYANTARDLAQHLKSQKLGECLDKIDDMALRAAEIVRRVRAFVDHRAAQRSKHDINELIREVLKMLGSDLKARQVAIACEFHPKLPEIDVDGIQIQQVLVNLIRNSVDSMINCDESSRHLAIQTEAIGESICVRVSDSGDGVNPAIASRIFQPFQSTRENGLGLGLAICRTLIDAHRGEINYYANSFGGAVFYFTLPAPKK